MGALGKAGQILSTPQQVLFKGIKAGREAVQGDGSKALHTLGSAGSEITDLLNITEDKGKDVSFTETIGAKKLPWGVETAAQMVADPLNFVTMGAGTVAKKGLQTAGKMGLKETIEQGGLKALGATGKKELREAIVREAVEAGAKNPEKLATKQLKALAKRGRGGLGISVPGTSKSMNVISSEEISRLPGAAMARAAKQGVKTSKVGSAVRGAVIPFARLSDRAGVEAGKAFGEAESRAFSKAGADTEDIVTRLQAGLSDFKGTAGRKLNEAEDSMIHHALETDAVESLPAPLQRIGKAIADMRATQTGDELLGGILKADGLRNTDEYLKRVRSDELEALHNAGKGTDSVITSGGSTTKNLNPGSLISRKIAPDATVKEINEVVRMIQEGAEVPAKFLEDADTLRNLAQRLPHGAKVYKESAIVSAVERGVESARALATAGYVNEVRTIKDTAGNFLVHSADDLEPAAAKSLGYKKFDLGKYGEFYAHPDTIAEMKKFMSIVGQDEIIGQWEKAMSKYNRWWKTQVTSSLPGGLPFALRNARSNVMLMAMDGMSPSWIGKAKTFQKNVKKIIENNAADIADRGVDAVMKDALGDDYKIWRAARDKGVIGDGFYHIDLDAAPEINVGGKKPMTGRNKVTRGAKTALREVAGTEGTLATKGRKFNSYIEDQARMASFLFNADRLGNLDDAALRVKAVLFDYGRLTPFEQKKLKFISPFYTFMRKNTPAQWRAFVENPGRYVLPEKISNATTDPLPEGSPEWQQRSGSRLLKFPGLNGMISTPERPFQAAVKAVEPFTQLAAGIIPGRQGAFEPTEGIPQALRAILSSTGGGALAPAKAAIEEATGTSSFTGYTLRDEDRLARAIGTALPALGHSPGSGYLPAKVTGQSRHDKTYSSGELVQILRALGVKLDPKDAKAMKREKLLEMARKAAEEQAKR